MMNEYVNDAGSGYPGIIVDISKAKSFDEVIEMVPAIGQKVESFPIRYDASKSEELEHNGHGEIESNRAIVNTTTGVCYSTASSTYGVCQHADALAITGAIRNHGGHFSQAGVLRDGGTAWIRMEFDEKVIIQQDGKPDLLIPSLNVLSDHTTSSANWVLYTTPRAACNNQCTSIKNGAEGKFAMRHRSSINERLIQANLAVEESAQTASDTIELFQRMAEIPMTDNQFSIFAKGLLDDSRGQSKRAIHEHGYEESKRRQDSIDELTAYFQSGNQGAGQTLWGGYNSVTGWLDHKHEVLDEAKLTRAKLERIWSSNLTGANAKLKDRGFSKLERMV